MQTTILSPTEKIKQLEAKLEELQTQPQPRSYKEQTKLEKECEYLQKNISNWQSYAELEPGMLVTKDKEFGVIDSKMLSQGGMPIIWVTWDESTVPTPEQPSRLKIIPKSVTSYQLSVPSETPEDERVSNSELLDSTMSHGDKTSETQPTTRLKTRNSELHTKNLVTGNCSLVTDVGSRVYFKEPTNTGIVLDVDPKDNLTQVAFDSDPEKPIWVATEFLSTVTYSPASPGSAEQHNLSEESPQLSSSKETPMRSPLSDGTSPVSQSTPTSETTTPLEESSIYSQLDSPAQEPVTLGNETDSSILTQPSGGKLSDVSGKDNQDLSLSNNPMVSDIEDLLKSSQALMPSGTWGNGKLYQYPTSAVVTNASESLLSPTPTASVGNGTQRPAGGNKLTTWCKNNELLRDGQVLNAQVVEFWQGFPLDWTAPVSAFHGDAQKNTLNGDNCSEKPSSPPKQQSHSNESNTLQAPPDESAMNKSSGYRLVKVSDLKPHPRNRSIYGEDEDISDLVEQIRRTAWIKPLVVNKNHQIISGHRRWKAALALGLETVPVEVREFDSELDELEALLLENQYRDKTIEQRVREAKVWSEIEGEKARVRQIELAGTRPNSPSDLVANLPQGTRSDLVANLPQGSKGKTRDKVAQKVGMKGRTYTKAAKVVQFMDEIAQSNPEKAESLRKTLNHKSVDAAFKKVSGIKKDISEQLREKPHAPFPYKVGEVCRVIPKDEPQLKGRGGCWAIVSNANEFCCDIELWNGKAELIRSEYLVSLEYTPEQCQQRQNKSDRIARLREYNLDPDAYSILSNIGKQKNPELRPFQEKLLSFLEQEYVLPEPLRGQACQLACCLEDCPEESLKGQSYELTCEVPKSEKVKAEQKESEQQEVTVSEDSFSDKPYQPGDIFYSQVSCNRYKVLKIHDDGSLLGKCLVHVAFPDLVGEEFTFPVHLCSLVSRASEQPDRKK